MALKYLYVPSGYKSGTAYGVLPNDSSADFDDFVRDTSSTRTNKDGLLESMGNNVPRLDYSDGGCPSLFLEFQRTNIVTYSEDFSQWEERNSATATLDSSTSNPKGELGAYIISNADGDGLSDNIVNMLVNTSASTTYTESIYVKSLGATEMDIRMRDNQTGSSPRFNHKFTTNEWERISLTSTTGSSTPSVRFVLGGSDGDFLVWGGQIEVGSFASSYIPNLSNGTTTRNGDKGNLAGNFDFNSAEGVLEARFKAFTTGNTSRRITLGATDSNRVVLGYGYNNGTVKPYLLIVGATGNDEIYISMPSSFNIFDYNTYQLKFQSGNNELKINGELVDTDTSFNTLNFTFSASLRNVSFNYYADSSTTVFYGGVKHIKVYDSITDF